MRIYIAGPISKGDQFLNCRDAVELADRLWALGHAPFVPHLNFVWHMLYPKPHCEWLAYDFRWIDACDALFRMPGESKGADEEVEYAKSIGLPVFHSLSEVPNDFLGEN